MSNYIEKLTVTSTAANLGMVLGNAADNTIDLSAYVATSGAINLVGGAGVDTIIGSSGSDWLTGGNWDPYGGAGVIEADGAIDTLKGGKGNDAYYVALVSDGHGGVTMEDAVIEDKNEGSDSLTLATGHWGETIDTTKINTITLVDNLENLYANATGETQLNLTGNALNNQIYGNQANNIINGGAGNDWLAGNGGGDTLIGGAGKDAFDLGNYYGDNGVSTVTDFVHGTDVLGFWYGGSDVALAGGKDTTVNADDFAGLVAASAFHSGNGAAAAATTEDQRYLYDTSNGYLYYDADGNGSSEAVVIAQVLNGGKATSLTASDIHLYWT
jgi:Ca2+-binding RTX toxin-like protein